MTTRAIAAARLLTLAGAGAAAGTALGLMGRALWPLDLFVHFQTQYAALHAACAAGLLALGRRWRALLLLPTLAINVALIAPGYGPAPDAAPASEGLRLVSFNVRMTNRRFDDVAAYLRSGGADVVSLQETDEAWVDAMRSAMTGFAVAGAVPQPDRHGILLLMATGRPGLELLGARPIALSAGEGASPALEARLAWRGRPLDLLTFHPGIPLSPRAPTERERQLAAAGRWARDHGPGAIILGDLNASPWSAPLRRAMAEGGLVDSGAGFGLQPGWPTWLPGPLRLPIDHVLHGGALVTLDRRLGPSLGSDHRLLSVTVDWE